MGKLGRFLIIIVGVVVLGVVVQVVFIDSPKKRQRKATLLLEQEQNVLEEYAHQFAQLKKVLMLSADEGIIEISFSNNLDVERAYMLKLQTLVLDLNEKKYILQNTKQQFDSLEDALVLVQISKAELEYWLDFLEHYKMYAIQTYWGKKYINFVFDRFHLIPHGLIYVFRCEGQEYFIGQIPGRTRGAHTAVYDIMAYLGHRWFYFEGP